MPKFVPFRGIRCNFDEVDDSASTPALFYDALSPKYQVLSIPSSFVPSSASHSGSISPRRLLLAISSFPGRSFSHANIRT
jgi:hypothetical protein